MILITGANGKTGRAVIKALLSKGERIRAFVRRTEQIEDIKSLGEMEVVTGDMLDQNAVNEALVGIRAVYHICSAMNPDEVQIGQVIIQAARLAEVEHFVFHSVIHPVIQEMPHHQKKLMVEELLVNSGIPYTIIQPGIFMQNILESWKLLSEKGIFRQKYFTTQETRICMIDLDDLAEAAAIILTRPGHTGASYEFSGPENLSLSDMIAAMEQHFGHEIKVETPQDEMFAAQLNSNGLGEYQVNTILKMFQHYNEHGSIGNSNVLTWILGRKPNDFSSFILRTLKSMN
ncbi:NmrA family NAD(P)-binding protein [Paenibacillus sp. CGMCC 1.16610]|uniref:NAD(P)H-binding protein n=1 Tax=Paenibacillus anseongense TaxID=2682845 RepID=A0ABW9U5Y4_9BACL|nr:MULTISPECIES: NmrA family NAD(P)-binding protein [Paenibacillus]MBA2936883.1 NmrA family NAD(P)-binding protein [Paenibacillus sp. CGMCC 1.16610]MVQ33210.1 NAD(P)H-binding protein [Paenibacillus anseongense]